MGQQLGVAGKWQADPIGIEPIGSAVGWSLVMD